MPSAELIINQPGQQTRKLEVTRKLVSIGRRPDNTIALEGDTNVSKYHAVIELREDGFWLSDLGSSNGTTVNDEPVRTERKLVNGDLIGVGGATTVEFLARDGEARHAPPPPSTQGTADAGGHTPAAVGANASAGGAAAAAPASAAAPAPSSGGMSPLLIAGMAVGGLVMVGALVAVLFATGVIGGSSDAAKKEEEARAQSKRPAQPDAEEEFDLEAEVDPSLKETPASPQTPEDAPASGTDAPASTSGAATATATDSDAAAFMADRLATQISQKSGYRFDPNFLNLIKQYTNEYRAAAGYYERARAHRDAIDREFVNNQGIQPPLIGYVMAMSQTKFVEQGAGGIWALPPAILNSSGAAAAADPAASTRAAAAYMKELLDLFGREHFVYAVACYGMTMDEAGKVKTDMEQRDPNGQLRYDFWQMKNAGVVSGVQVERVARFFAAGIVGENPQRFGLKDRQLSALYD